MEIIYPLAYTEVVVKQGSEILATLTIPPHDRDSDESGRIQKMIAFEIPADGEVRVIARYGNSSAVEDLPIMILWELSLE